MAKQEKIAVSEYTKEHDHAKAQLVKQNQIRDPNLRLLISNCFQARIRVFAPTAGFVHNAALVRNECIRLLGFWRGQR